MLQAALPTWIAFIQMLLVDIWHGGLSDEAVEAWPTRTCMSCSLAAVVSTGYHQAIVINQRVLFIAKHQFATGLNPTSLDIHTRLNNLDDLHGYLGFGLIVPFFDVIDHFIRRFWS